MSLLFKFTQKLQPCSQKITIVRAGHMIRGKPAGVARTIEQRLQELRYKDPELYFKVNIGLPALKESVDRLERIQQLKSNRNNSQLEKKARNKELNISLDEATSIWLKNEGKIHVKTICEHYSVFEHLFGDAFFYPSFPLKVMYNLNDVDVPVYYGNVVKPSEASKAPQVNYECDKNDLYTLVLTNPDGHLTENDKEYVHWFIANIPGNNLEKGETLIKYLQPFPPRGTGFHRHVFVLYKQDKKLDLQEYKKSGDCLDLNERTFSTPDFYRKYQEVITPASICFFQSDWDPSLTDFYHNTLDMKEPVFEYMFPETYVKPQTWFPIREAFNLYMDRYRDPKQIKKEFLMRKLKDVHPFKPPKAPLTYPNVSPWPDYIPTWLKLEKTKSRLGWGRINDIKR